MSSIYASEEQAIQMAIDAFPATFGLRGFPGGVFRLNAQNSFVSGGALKLYTDRRTEDGTWAAFSKCTFDELNHEIIVSTADQHVLRLAAQLAADNGQHETARQLREQLCSPEHPCHECNECLHRQHRIDRMGQ